MQRTPLSAMPTSPLSGATRYGGTLGAIVTRGTPVEETALFPPRKIEVNRSLRKKLISNLEI